MENIIDGTDNLELATGAAAMTGAGAVVGKLGASALTKVFAISATRVAAGSVLGPIGTVAGALYTVYDIAENPEFYAEAGKELVDIGNSAIDSTKSTIMAWFGNDNEEIMTAENKAKFDTGTGLVTDGSGNILANHDGIEFQTYDEEIALTTGVLAAATIAKTTFGGGGKNFDHVVEPAIDGEFSKNGDSDGNRTKNKKSDNDGNQDHENKDKEPESKDKESDNKDKEPDSKDKNPAAKKSNLMKYIKRGGLLGLATGSILGLNVAVEEMTGYGILDVFKSDSELIALSIARDVDKTIDTFLPEGTSFSTLPSSARSYMSLVSEQTLKFEHALTNDFKQAALSIGIETRHGDFNSFAQERFKDSLRGSVYDKMIEDGTIDKHYNKFATELFDNHIMTKFTNTIRGDWKANHGGGSAGLPSSVTNKIMDNSYDRIREAAGIPVPAGKTMIDLMNKVTQTSHDDAPIPTQNFG